MTGKLIYTLMCRSIVQANVWFLKEWTDRADMHMGMPDIESRWVQARARHAILIP